MGTDDFFKKRKKERKERKKEIKTPKPCSFLIVSEGEKTEPLYFDGLKSYLDKKYGDSIEVKKPFIETQGEGRCTVSLVNETAKIVSRAPVIYENIWVVFDKDSFDDFDEAVELAESYGFKAAWSNESFEYWIYLHFNYCDSALGRDDWVKKLDEIYKSNEINKKGYQKNDPNIFTIATTSGSLKSAVRNAKSIEAKNKGRKPSKSNPGTTVHHLILELKPYIEELL